MKQRVITNQEAFGFAPLHLGRAALLIVAFLVVITGSAWGQPMPTEIDITGFDNLNNAVFRFSSPGGPEPFSGAPICLDRLPLKLFVHVSALDFPDPNQPGSGLSGPVTLEVVTDPGAVVVEDFAGTTDLLGEITFYSSILGPPGSYGVSADFAGTVQSDQDGNPMEFASVSTEGLFELVDCTPPPPSAEPRTIGYWKSHPAHLGVLLGRPINLGLQPPGNPILVSTVEEAVEILRSHNSKDALDSLAAQLLATILNLRNGTDPYAAGGDIQIDVKAAKVLLSSHIGDSVTGKQPNRDEALALQHALDVYNNSGEG